MGYKPDNPGIIDRIANEISYWGVTVALIVDFGKEETRDGGKIAA